MIPERFSLTNKNPLKNIKIQKIDPYKIKKCFNNFGMTIFKPEFFVKIIDPYEIKKCFNNFGMTIFDDSIFSLLIN